MKTLFLLSSLAAFSLTVSATKLGMPSNVPTLYEAECASCHLACPPGLMGQRSWQNFMTGLEKHFGTDASLDPKSQAEITQWLNKNAAIKKKYSALAPENRFTRTAWFINKHDELKAEVWQRVGVKSPANCSACHANFAKGDFNEDRVRIPSK